MKEKLLVLMGPTASGKSALAMRAAPELGAEIVSMDSMMVYRGMDIGTAKPTTEERERVRHHLIDIVEPTEEYSVGRFCEDAESVMEGIRERGKRALVVGGTALYWRALTRGLFAGPPASWEVRSRLKEEAGEKGTAALHEVLRKADPEAAEKIHPNDLRRIVRALEVMELTGRPMSEMQKSSPGIVDPKEAVVAAVKVPRELLYERINRRVEAMFEAGLVKEVEGLVGKHGNLGRSASQALGYREALEYLDEARGLEETVELVKKKTRHFARRQLTWLRGFEETRWVETEDPEGEEAARAVLDVFSEA